MEAFKKFIAFLHWHIKVKGKNNKYNTDLLLKDDVRLRIKGNNNQLIIGKNCSLKNVAISIYGNDNIIKFGDNCNISNMIIENGFKWHNNANNCSISIGYGAGLNSASLILLEDGSKITIGTNCISAAGIELWATDTHSITDLEGNLLNYGGNIIIGNNVWLGKDVKICKNAQIPDNSVVGFSSVVAAKFSQPNVILAGNPAKIVKENIKWDKRSPQTYLQQNQKKSEQ